MKGFVIAGTHSGCGKTTITLGIMAALKRRGLSVAPFKVGPDFIDPGHHTQITGIPSRNLDGWMLPKTYNMSCFQRHTQGYDIAIIEGVMGLFDGYDGKSEAGSTAQMAKWLGFPVILIVDAKSMARSAAAVVQGFERFDKELSFAGVIFNNVGSQRHLSYLKQSLENQVNMPCLGGIPRDQQISIPERHLGLFTEQDHPLSEDRINKLADMIDTHIEVQCILETPKQKSEINTEQNAIPDSQFAITNPVRIGIAKDNAFCFYYQDNLDMLQSCGAELVYFSPIKENALPQNLDGIYFGGGYPELFAEKLAEKSDLKRHIKEKSSEGMPIYGECGGFMYLCKDICTLDGSIYPMTGCFPYITSMLPRLKSLGYREITLSKDTIIGNKGNVIRGHEFHYSEIQEHHPPAPSPKGEGKKIVVQKAVYQVADRTGKTISPPLLLERDTGGEVEGYQVFQTLGSYIHLHFGSMPDAARNFVIACQNYKKEKK